MNRALSKGYIRRSTFGFCVLATKELAMLDKSYRPQEAEHQTYDNWERTGAFASGRSANAKPYTIVIPPPNVTGSLHIGHALNNTLQDVLIRYQRLRGRDALWQPGTDHAGIATQMVIERQLAEEGKTRHDLGRQGFIDRVWQWREESGGTITQQLRRLGASCDWSRERFTMDDGLSAAVLKVFVDLHKQNLIYRDKRLVNWDCKLHTAISDLEVEQRDVQGHMWHIKYPIEGLDNTYITVGTTRPETMLGDSGVAVHPDDERYRHLVGKFALLPLVGRRIPIFADDYADPEQGSGAVKITPAHDFNDFDVGRRHDLDVINILDENAHLNDAVPDPYRGLDRFVARKQVVADLEVLGLVEMIDDITHVLPFGDRSGVVIEPWLTDQWYVDAKTLAEPAIKAVEDGRIQIVPKQWETTYFEWMRNIQPWCVSRQIWWGHQIPAWYGPDGEIFVELSEAEALAAARAHYGRDDVELRRDEDVLDTWFSSALWPFSTLGWPEETPELARYYPTDVLVTAFDIIFFWVARMIMMGLHFMDEVPFHTVYVHALVRDEHGQKMSKSKGNVIDPLELIDEYGADALRFTLTAMAAQGRDIKLTESRIEGYRNFGTKLWNAARLCEMNDCRVPPGFDAYSTDHRLNRWIVGATARAETAVRGALEDYRFNEAANEIYQFTWHVFCDWYLEFAKPLLQSDDAALQAETRAVAGWVLEQVLIMLHPVMPFITADLSAQMGGADALQLDTAVWPDHPDDAGDAEADAEIGWMIDLISDIRSVRAEMRVPPGAKTGLALIDAGDGVRSWLENNWTLVSRMARLDDYDFVETPPEGSVQLVSGETTIALPIAEIIDIAKERQRLEKEIDKADRDIGKIDAKLANTGFLAKAPEHVVALQHERRADAANARAKLTAALDRLPAA